MRARRTYLCLLVLGMMFLQTSTLPAIAVGTGNERLPDADAGTGRFTFDRDGDRIDDSLWEGEAGLPLWAFIHPTPGAMEDLVELLDGEGIAHEPPLRYVGAVAARFEDLDQVVDLSTHDVVALIEADGEVRFAIDISAKAMKVVPSTTYSPHSVHDLGYKGEGMTVAVLDLGIDNEHPTLQGSFVAGADFSKPESPASPRDGTFDPDDHNGHGTAVASVLLGRGEEGMHVGIAPRAGLIDLKMSDLNPAYQHNMAEAMEWCLDNADTPWNDMHVGIDVISMSALTNTRPGSTLGELQSRIAEAGIPFIQAAGNDGVQQGTDPATYWWSDDVIIAGGLDDRRTVHRGDDVYWANATYGPRESDGDDDPYDELKPDVVATAVNLTLAGHSASELGSAQGWYGPYQGTSYATPHVSGIVTLMVEANPGLLDLGGKNVVETIRSILHETAETRGEPYDPSLSTNYNQRYGYGIVDAYAAVKRALDMRPTNRPPSISSLSASPTSIAPGGTCEIVVSALDPDGDSLTYSLSADGGSVSGQGPTWEWTAPQGEGDHHLTATVADPRGLSDSAVVVVEVVDEGPAVENGPPRISSFTADRTSLRTGEAATLTVTASDPDGDDIEYRYSADLGSIEGDGASVTYKAPDREGKARVTVTVSDPDGEEDEASLTLTISAPPPPLPPVITWVELDPATITEGDRDVGVVLSAKVLGMGADIDEVTADLSAIGGSRGAMLKDDGRDPDEDAGDLVFSIALPGVSTLAPGSYSLAVHCTDVDGRDSGTETVTLVVRQATDQPKDKDGDDGGDDEDNPFTNGTMAFGVIAVAVIALVGVRLRKRF